MGIAGREKLRYDERAVLCSRKFTAPRGEEDDTMARNRDVKVVVCPKCGERIENPGKFCPNCAEALVPEPGSGGYDYVTFGGNVPEELQVIEETGLSAVVWLRILSVTALLLGIILGLTLGGGDWRFNWYLVFVCWGCGLGASVLLFLASLAVKLARRKKDGGEE